MKIEGYELIREINRGPVATVYLARQLALDRQVFLKVLNKNIHDQPDLLERFKREARICARLNHPNIVNIFDFEDTGHLFYLSFEYVDGQSLDEFIKQFNGLPWPAIFFILYEVSKGLHFAHQHGVLHRDIKPANIMIGRDGSVKITDFGLATSADLPNLTIQQAAVGTPAYMSPEQATGKKLDAKSDIFSLGITIYEMCAGRNPFLGQNVVDTLNHVLSTNPEPLSKIRNDCPPWFEQLVESMLKKKREQRMASLQEVLNHHQLKQNLPEQDQFLELLTSPQEHQASMIIKAKQPTNKKKARFIRSGFSVLTLLSLLLLLIFYFKSTTNVSSKSEGAVTSSDTIQPTIITDSLRKELPVPGHRSSSTSRQPSAQSPISEKAAIKSTQISNLPVDRKPETGRLFIFCTPWAQVFINGTFFDTTPLANALELEKGTYTLTLKNPNYHSLEKAISIVPGQLDTLVFRLKPKTGLLQITAFPWGKVFIDDTLKGITPLRLKIPAGKHRLTLKNPNFKTFSDTILIKPGENLEKRIQLKK